jgi:DNA-binding transcriptional MocR family regulator
MTKMAGAEEHKYEQVAAEIANLIERGTYRPGDRIPSVRQLSRQKRVSITTILQSYYLLEAQGLIEARPRSGFYVRTTLPQALPEPEISSPRPDPTEVSVYELVKMVVLYDALNPHLIQLGAAHPNPHLTATKKLNRILCSIARQMGDESGLYDYPPGCEPLRVQIAQRAVATGCNLAPDDIVTTSGCSEAVSLCLRATCQPGDTVAIESPISFDALQTLEALKLQALEIPTHPRNGISLDALRFAVEHNPVRACMVISNFNNPLGSCIPDENKKKLVALLARHEIPLVENNIFGELYFGDQRPTVAKAYDRRGLVLLCSSFSKDLCPGYRVGWTAAGQFRNKVEWLKYTNSLATPTLPQLAIAQFLAGGSYDHHLRRIRRQYARNVASLLQAVRRYFPKGTRVTRPQGGFLLWVQLPDPIDSLELYKAGSRAGIAITPGYLFSATKQYPNFVRLNAAKWSEETNRAIERLGELAGRLI